MPDELFNDLKKKYEKSLKGSFKAMYKSKRIMGAFFGGLCFLAALLVIATFFNFDFGTGIIAGLILFYFMSMILFVIKDVHKETGLFEYNTLYYGTVIKDLIGSIFGDVEYSDEDAYNFKNNYKDAKLFSYNEDTIKSEWKIKYDNKDLLLYDILLENEGVEKKDGKYVITVFGGLFGVFDLGLNTKQVLNVDNKKIGLSLDNKELSLVNIDSVDFSNKFEVYSSDKVIAMRVLTHDVMDNILKLIKDSNLEISFKIHNNKLYFLISTDDCFSNNSSESINKEELNNDYKNINLVKDIIVLISNSIKNNGIGE